MSLFSLNDYDLVVSVNQRPDLHVRLGPHQSLYDSIFDNAEQVSYFRLNSVTIIFMSLLSLNGYDLVVSGNQRPDLHLRLGRHHLLLYSLYVSIFDNAEEVSYFRLKSASILFVIIQSEWLRSCRIMQPMARSTRTSRTPPFVVIFLIFDNAQLFSAQFCYNNFYVIIQSEWLRSCRVRQPTTRSTRTSRTPPILI